ncbi:MAG: glycosyltransferase family 4 protein [Desulfatibacillaceae bacterium]
MRILIVSTDFPPASGGISRFSDQLARALCRDDTVIVLAPGARSAAVLDKAASYTCVRTPDIPMARVLFMCLWLPWTMALHRPDAVLHMVWTTSLFSHLWRPLFRAPWFVFVHCSEIMDDTTTFRRRVKGWLRPWRIAALSRAAGVFAVSAYSRRVAQGNTRRPERIRVIHPGVDPDAYTPRGEEQNDPPRLLTVSRLELHKGHDRVLEALAGLNSEGVAFEYVVAGRGKEMERLQAMARDLGIAEKVRFAGYVPDEELPALYASADVYIMPSREIPGRPDIIEGFGISFVEAGAAGVPVIGGRSGGVPDSVRDGGTGLLVDPDSPKDIADAIRRLLADSALARRLGSAGRARAENELAWPLVAQRVREAMREMIEEGR